MKSRVPGMVDAPGSSGSIGSFSAAPSSSGGSSSSSGSASGSSGSSGALSAGPASGSSSGSSTGAASSTGSAAAAPIAVDALYGYALLGARASSFHHDLAAKLQGLMMALDEIGDELEGGRHSELQEASTTARGALEELTVLLATNRALARSARSELSLRDAVATASARANVVVRGEIPDVELLVVAPAFIQALAMLFASTGKNRRGSGGAVDVRVANNELAFAAGPEGAAGTELAIAAWAIARDGGELRCGRDIVVRLPPSV